ncbi:MAG: IS21-like element helper ATPase IstB [Alphaproteobacteria bacterium]
MEALDSYLKALKLPEILSSYKKQAEESLKAGESYEAFLCLLAEQEVLGRSSRQVQARIKKAFFPSLKMLESFDFAVLPSLDKKRVLSLARGDYLDKYENLLAIGNSGTGKTHLAIALGMAACQQNHSVLFQTAAHLVHTLTEAHDAKRLLALQRKLKNNKLLIIDELGYVPFSKTGSELLFEVLSQRYENGSIIITSNLPFEEWPQVFGCSRLTGALLDRLTHHAHIMEINGPSYRVAERSGKKGSTAPT